MRPEAITSRVRHISPAAAIAPGPGPWWEKLDPDFRHRPERFAMPMGDRVKVSATAAADRLINTLASSLFSLSILPQGSRRQVLGSYASEPNAYHAAALSADPTILFRPPSDDVVIETSYARGLHFRPKDGFRERIRFVSPYQALDPRRTATFTGEPRNRIASALHWRHNDGPRPTIIGIHGFNADPFLLNQEVFALPWFYELGCDVLLFTMPFHGSRAPWTSLFSGQHFFSGGPAHINEAFGQAICDLQVIIRYLMDELGVPSVGATGISLGGNTAALLAAVEPRLHFSMPNVPVVSLGDLLLEWHPLAEIISMRMKQLGADIYDLRAAFAAVSPLSYPAKLPKEHLFIIAGAADRMAPPKQARLLHEHWQRCDIHWFPGNHVLHFDRGNYLRQMARVMNNIGFLEDDRAA